jgi:hypothetical protein
MYICTRAYRYAEAQLRTGLTWGTDPKRYSALSKGTNLMAIYSTSTDWGLSVLLESSLLRQSTALGRRITLPPLTASVV